ncbi:MAG: Lytic transglycosylase, catalytic [Cereibacter sp.]|nr:Lytic transglycosylase, catalytic [Cereibacter sp.]
MGGPTLSRPVANPAFLALAAALAKFPPRRDWRCCVLRGVKAWGKFRGMIRRTLSSPRRPGRLAPFVLLFWLVASLLGPVAAARADEAGALRTALQRVAARDWTAAQAAARDAGSIGQAIVEWHRLRAGEGLLGDYETFLARYPDWPGLPLLRQKGEAAVARSTTPERVLGYFGNGPAETAQGAIAQVRALIAAGRVAEAETRAMQAWTELGFEPEEEVALLALAPEALALAHEARLDRLLWQNRPEQAERMLSRVSPGWRALGRARMALRADAAGVDTLIAAVPAALAADPGLAYERFLWRARKGRTDDAAALLLERSADAASLGDPAAWAARRPGIARGLLDEGEIRTAYKVAAGHGLDGGGTFADLEFLAGFIALRRLEDPATALGHFKRLEAAVRTPISLSRALYWQGRSLEAMGQLDAAGAAYAAGAQHQTAYYGQLAAERAGIPLDPALLQPTRVGDWRQAGFANSSVLAAARLLLKAGDLDQGKRFLLHLGEGLGAEDMAALADMALGMGEPHIAVLLGKQAAERGIILPAAYFPVSEMVPSDGLPVSRALALSIARRESEFNPVVVSPAGARGLMQVMPGTGRMMAAKTGSVFEPRMLTSDPAFNVRMGTAYLAQLVEEFGPSIALIASGYNAGPGRPRRWVQEFGDPRAPEVDVVDWVETIPFAETRTYVMRVAESVVIYRAKLRGAGGPVRITAELKG